MWLNADVLVGPGGTPCKFDADAFVVACLRSGPAHAKLSIGWTVSATRNPLAVGYTPAMIDAMLALCVRHGLANVTFPVRCGASK